MTMTTEAGMTGWAPSVTVTNPEQSKYERLWKLDAYRQYSPGENLAMTFLSWVKPKAGSTVIDYGCGTGRGGLMLAALGNLKVTMLDFVEGCLDEDIKNATQNQGEYLQFFVHDLTNIPTHRAKYGYCTDVMEHIPEGQVETVLRNIVKSAENVFFNISLQEDSCGSLINENLHVTVKPAGWWIQKLRGLDCVIYNSEVRGSDLLVYVSAWNTAKELMKFGTLNTSEDRMVENVEVNTSKGYQQVTPYNKNNLEMMLIGGGPSLHEFKDDIIAKREAGMALVTTNGAYNEMISWGLQPSAQVIVDSRPFNKRFLEPIVPTCKYMLASQVDPSLFEGIPHDQVWLWHAALNERIEKILDDVYQGEWYPVPGGSTVVLRAITLFRLLGYARMHIYGFDSCLSGDQHHAYEQAENDDKQLLTVTLGDRVFTCQSWMVSQAQEFADQIKMIGDEIELAIYGDGLPAYILRYAAESEDLIV